jgi:hypothetical protein
MIDDIGLTSGFASSLVLLIIGTAFLVDRIRYLKKGNIAVATVFKREESTDNEDNIIYIPFFKFTTRSNIEVIYEHRATSCKSRWTIGDKVIMVYREGLSGIHDQLPLLFYDAFAIPATLLTADVLILTITCCKYYNASGPTMAYLIPGLPALFFFAFYGWAHYFFKTLITCKKPSHLL